MNLYLFQVQRKKRKSIVKESSTRNIQLIKEIVNERGIFQTESFFNYDNQDSFFKDKNENLNSNSSINLKKSMVELVSFLDLMTYQGYNFNYRLYNKTKIQKRFLKILLFNDGICGFLCILSIILSFIDYEAFKCQVFQENFMFHPYDLSNNYYKAVSSLLTILILIFNLIYHYYKYVFLIENSILPKKNTYFKRNFLQFAFETLFILPHPIIFVSYSYKNLFYALYALSILKVYFYTRFFINISSFNSLINVDILWKNSIIIDIYFIVKCIMKTKGLLMILYTLIHVIIVNSYLIYVFAYDCNDQSKYFNQFYNCIFFIITTMTTVGYGEVVDILPINKVMLVNVILLGQFLISLMILWATKAILFNKHEEKAYVVLNRFVYKDKLRKIAQRIICLGYKRYRLQKRLIMKYKEDIGIKKNREGEYFIYNEDLFFNQSKLTERYKNYIYSNEKVMEMSMKIKKFNEKIINIKLILDRDSSVLYENKFFDIQDLIENDMKSIKESISELVDFKQKLKQGLQIQRESLFNVIVLKKKLKKLIFPMVKSVNYVKIDVNHRMFTSNQTLNLVFNKIDCKDNKEEYSRKNINKKYNEIFSEERLNFAYICDSSYEKINYKVKAFDKENEVLNDRISRILLGISYKNAFKSIYSQEKEEEDGCN